LKKNIELSYKLLIISSFVLLLFVLSCTEEEQNTFDGTVVDMSSGEPVAGVKVYLDASKVSSTSISSAFNQIAETTTDATGNYYFECENNSYLKFRLRFEKEGFHASTYEFDPSDQVAHYETDRLFARESYVYVRILNLLPYNDEDQLKVRVERINEECTDCCGADFRYYLGALTDTSFCCSTVGGDSVVIYSISIHNDESQIRENKIYCIPGDTVFYNCYY
jgi:5-hydroxyisourate hydrolase-like protein (transthyretin family)